MLKREIQKGEDVKAFSVFSTEDVNRLTGRPMSWRALRVYHIYRTSLALLLQSTVMFDFNRYLAINDFALFKISSFVYLALVVFSAVSFKARYFSFVRQVILAVIVDILYFSCLAHASHEIAGIIAVLMNVSIAYGSLLIPSPLAFVFAAMASIAVLLEQIWLGLNSDHVWMGPVQAGIEGLTFFATAALGYLFSQNLSRSDRLVEQRNIDLKRLTKLNELIIHRLNSGIILLDQDGYVRWLNPAAQRLLKNNNPMIGVHLSTVNAKLLAVLQRWQQAPMSNQTPLPLSEQDHSLSVQFSLLDQNPMMIIMFLDDASRTIQQAQQMKLASLGQLSAGIAHELRNPLSAISHAAQLLAERDDLHTESSRMIEIIVKNCNRTDAIINNVLQLARGKQSQPEWLDLNEWLNEFQHEFSRARDPKPIFHFQQTQKIQLMFDPIQLQQVLYNLCENGLRYSLRAQNLAELDILVDKDEWDRPYIEITDYGPGISAELAANIFQPFFTTERQGTGLGLYVARELCEANQAQLSVIEHKKTGCFRITFYQPQVAIVEVKKHART